MTTDSSLNSYSEIEETEADLDEESLVEKEFQLSEISDNEDEPMETSCKDNVVIWKLLLCQVNPTRALVKMSLLILRSFKVVDIVNFLLNGIEHILG